MNFVCFNGEMVMHQALLTAQNRAFRYGDGVFETMKVFRSNVLLSEYHFDRLFSSLLLLKISVPEYITRAELHRKVLDLCSLNNCSDSARVRVTFYRENENKCGFIIEANFLETSRNQLNENGWTIGIYPFARKSCDAFANLKSANYLPYVLADLYAQENKWEECIVLNSENKICDASKANIFSVINNEVNTPALHQGCISGVKRRFIIEELKKEGVVVHQRIVDEKLLLQSDEIFLTNAINDIRWVKTFKEKTYTNSFTAQFYVEKFSSIYS